MQALSEEKRNEKPKKGFLKKPVKRLQKQADNKNNLNPKDLKKQRREQKLSNNYKISVDMKKIWEVLRK